MDMHHLWIKNNNEDNEVIFKEKEKNVVLQ